MGQDKRNDTKDEYCFNRLPKNIRQVGETMQGTRFFIEDYVMTFLHKCIDEKREEGIVIFIGKKGFRDAKDCIFIYGAIPVDCDIQASEKILGVEQWKEIYQTVQDFFPGGEIYGFGCGVGIWNSQVDESVRTIQKEHFCVDDRFVFLSDLSEKEEKVFYTKEEALKELAGYIIYFDKNPQMQDYMLANTPKKSLEGNYCDEVTHNIREVIHKKNEEVDNRKVATFGMSVMLFLLSAIGAILLFQSTQRIQNLQQTIETLSSSTGKVLTESAITVATSTPAQTDLSTKQPKSNASKKGTKKIADVDVPKATQKIKVTASPRATSKAVTIPKSKVVSKPVSTPTPRSAGYKVKAGDTLSQIVWRQYRNMKCMAMVKRVNNIKDDDKIKEGQYLLLPEYED